MSVEAPRRRWDGFLTHKEAMAGIATGLTLMGLFGSFVMARAEKATDGVRAEVRDDRKQNAADVRQVREDSANAVQLVREEMKETRTDIRALSREIRTGQKSQRLSVPVPELKPATEEK